MRSFFKSTAFRIITVLIALGLIYVIVQSRGGHDDGSSNDGEGRLRCCIAIKSSIASLSSRAVGFSYELLNYFADDNGKDLSFARYSDKSVWDSLSRGDIDMIVFDYEEDPTTVKAYGDAFIVSVPIKGDICLAVKSDNAELLNSFNFWFSSFKETRPYSMLTRRFFRSYNIETMTGNTLSPYDDVIKKYSAFSGLDWVLVSALAWQESHYYMGTQSGSALGLMQIKQSTAAHYGVEDVYDPELNIKAGTLHLQHLIRTYRDEGVDSLNAVKFALAAYNAGEGRIEECRAHAAESGYNRNDVDQVALSLSSHPTFVGEQTINYVDEILYRYRQYNELLK